jgi:hypothetical protein
VPFPQPTRPIRKDFELSGFNCLCLDILVLNLRNLISSGLVQGLGSLFLVQRPGLVNLNPHSGHEEVVCSRYVLFLFWFDHVDSNFLDFFESDFELLNFVHNTPHHGNLSARKEAV